MIKAALSVWMVLILVCGQAIAAGDVTAGKSKAAACIACHGVDGNSTNPEWPSLAGQNEIYIARQLAAFQQGETRSNVLMAPMIANLSEQDMADIAAYYASLPRARMYADETKQELIAAGQRLYRGGNADKNVAACIGCHLPDGSGNGPAGFPGIANQHATYTENQLKAFRSGARSSDLNSMMRDVSARLSDDEIEAVAAYLTGLN